MGSELVVLILSILLFSAVISGSVNIVGIKSFQAQKEEVERIFRQRVFKGEEFTVAELGRFFSKISRRILLASISFASAFVLFIMVAKRLWPSDSIPKTIFSVCILLVVFGGPMVMLAMADKNIVHLKKDVLHRINAEE